MECSSNKVNFGIIILAAGMSSRLGAPKQLLPYKGSSLLSNAILTAQQVKAAVTIVVLGAHATLLKEELKDVESNIVVNERYQEGMASSIRCGLKYLNDRYKNIEGLLIMVCDQPHVDAVHLEALIKKQSLTKASIVASTYADRKGVPAFFTKEMFPALEKLTGDAGARYILKQQHNVATVDFPLGDIDIDTRKAYDQLLETTKTNNLTAR